MKKTLILAGIALLAISSCAKDVVVDTNKGHAIDFRVVETKGAAISYSSDLQEFFVTAVDAADANYFTNVGFARLGEYFYSNPEYYWPADGSDLRFYAYAPSLENQTATVTLTAAEQKIKGFTPSADIQKHVDLVTCAAVGNSTNVDGLTMDFNHRLTRVHLSAWESNAEYNYSVAAVKLANVVSSGDFDLATNEWTLGAEKIDYVLELPEPIELSSSTENLTYTRVEGESLYDYELYNDAMFVPQQLTPWDPTNDPTNANKGAYIAVKVKINSVGSGDQIFPAAAGEYGWVAIPVPTTSGKEYWDLLQGDLYSLNLNFTNGAGYVEPGPYTPTPEPVLGQDVKFTLKVNPTELPTEEASTRKALEGEWLAKSVWNHYEYPADYDFDRYSTYTDYGYDTPEEMKRYFNNNGFYHFTVDNNYNLYLTTPGGVSAKTAFTVSDDGKYIYLECYKRPDGTYELVSEVYEISENNCTILVKDAGYSSGVVRYQYIYYDKF